MYWKNSQFQIINFIAGKCFTPDEIYRVLSELEVDRVLAINEYDAFKVETEGRLQELNSLTNPNYRDVAETLRLKSTLEHSTNCYTQAVSELEFIKESKSRVDKHRIYKNLPDSEAFQMCQQLEWKLRLENQARLQLMSSGQVSEELLNTIRVHPDKSEILDSIQLLISSKVDITALESPIHLLTKD